MMEKRNIEIAFLSPYLFVRKSLRNDYFEMRDHEETNNPQRSKEDTTEEYRKSKVSTPSMVGTVNHSKKKPPWLSEIKKRRKKNAHTHTHPQEDKNKIKTKHGSQNAHNLENNKNRTENPFCLRFFYSNHTRIRLREHQANRLREKYIVRSSPGLHYMDIFIISHQRRGQPTTAPRHQWQQQQ